MRWSHHRSWLKASAARLDVARARIIARHGALAMALALTLAYVIGTGLSLKAGLLGMVLAVLGAALWPVREFHRAAPTDTPSAAMTGEDVLWRAAIAALPDPIIVLDGTAHVICVNAAAAALFGVRRAGGHIAAVSRDPELLDAVDRALASGQTGRVELDQRVPVERRLLVSIAPLRAAPQRGLLLPALLLCFRDFGDQDRIARMHADFVANASHELRTPLASLKGFVETLQGAAKDDPAARERFLEVMREQAERMTRLIDDLLSLSRVEMREHVPPGASVELNETLAHVIQTLAPLAEKAGARVIFAPPAGRAEVRGERDELVQVFQNVIQNAIKYGKAGGRVDVSLTHEPAAGGRSARWAVAIVDDGPGIAPQHLPRLTERFYRVNVAASREKGGTGLGLAIVKHILNRHRGELTISSKLGAGSTFIIALPAAGEARSGMRSA